MRSWTAQIPSASVVWIGVACSLLPISALASFWGIGFFQAQAATFILIGLACLVWLVPDWWLRAGLLWVLVSFVWSGARLWGLAGVLGVLAWALLYRTAGQLDARARQWVAQVLTGAMLFQVGWMAMQAVGYDPLFVPITWRGEAYLGPAGSGLPPPVVGFFGNPMDAALFLGLSLPVVLSLHWSLGAAVSVALIGLRATVGIVCLLIAWVWWAGWRWARITVPVTLVALGAHLWVWDPQRLGSKGLAWRQAWRLVQYEPLFGWGPNALEYRITMAQAQADQSVRLVSDDLLRWNFVFNEWLHGAMEIGVIGAALAAGYVLCLSYRLCQRRRWSHAGPWLPAGLCALAASTFSIPLRSAPAALLVAVIFGCLSRMARASEGVP